MSIAITTQFICFTVLSLVVIIGALGVVLLESIVYSAFLLGGVFMSVAGLYLLLNASFVAAAQVLVYVGAVNVLIIFAIMLVNKKEDFTKGDINTNFIAETYENGYEGKIDNKKEQESIILLAISYHINYLYSVNTDIKYISKNWAS